MAARGRSSSGTARLLVLVGILTVLGATFGVGVYTGRIWSARAAVVSAHAPETEPARRGPGRGGRPPGAPAPPLTFYREVTAPLTPQIGRAAWRGKREISGGAGSFKKKKNESTGWSRNE